MLIAVIQTSIPALALIIVQLIISAKQQRVQDTKNEMTIQEFKEDIKRLEAKQDKHNSLIERVTKLEIRDEAQWRWIDEFKDRIPGNRT